VAELAEPARREHEAPWGVQLAVRDQPPHQPAARGVDVHEAEPGTLHVVLTGGVLHRVADHDRAVDRLNPERCEPRRDIRVLERTRHVHRGEAPVEHVDLRVVEVRRVQERPALLGGRERKSLVDRPVRCGEFRHGTCAGRLVPSRDLTGLGREDEQGRSGRAQLELVGGVEHRARRRAARNVHHQRRLRDQRPPDAARVDRGLVRAVVGHPQGRLRAGRKAPRVHQVRIGDVGDTGDVGDEVFLPVGARLLFAAGQSGSREHERRERAKERSAGEKRTRSRHAEPPQLAAPLQPLPATTPRPLRSFQALCKNQRPVIRSRKTTALRPSVRTSSK
jgi:hypothetical protein